MCKPSAARRLFRFLLLFVLLDYSAVELVSSSVSGDGPVRHRQFADRSSSNGSAAAAAKYSLDLVNIAAKTVVFINLRRDDYFSRPDFIDREDLYAKRTNKSSMRIDFDEIESTRNLCVRSGGFRSQHQAHAGLFVSSCKRRPSLAGLRANGHRVESTEDGLLTIPVNAQVSVFLFGADFTNTTEIGFTDIAQHRGARCDDLPLVEIYPASSANMISDRTLIIDISLPTLLRGEMYYICLRDTTETIPRWTHQGDDQWLALKPVSPPLPLGLHIVILCCLLMLSGLFSGLNLGLMTLECTELKILEKCGTESEKKYAQKIYPVRKMCNYLLCTLLLGNVLVNNSLTILLDDLTSGMIAVILSTFAIVVMGEIIPQALCSRHGLAIGAKTLWITKVFMVLTFPLSFPISKVLDLVLGDEIRTVYNRKRLMEFIRLTKDYNDLQNQEVDIITGALELTKKTVAEVMTKISDVFMVPLGSVLNFETVSDIMKQGYSRIPVYDGERQNVVALLNIKDLAFVDPDTETLLKTLCEFYNHPVNFVFEDTTLDVMLNEFKKGRSHMAFVRRVNSEQDGDPFYELIGIVTLEDVIEEIIQSEIIDESDVLTDNRQKRLRKESQIKQDFSDFAKLAGGDKKVTKISPQLALATYQYLSTAVEPFKISYLSESVLKKLLAQDVFFRAKPQGKDGGVPASNVLVQNGKVADYYILILEGRCLVTVGRENLVFEAGPFNSFGLPAITVDHQDGGSSSSISSAEGGVTPFKVFVPDYTVVAVGDTVYMKVHNAVYLSALKATKLERKRKIDSDSREESKSESGHNSRRSSNDVIESFIV